MRNFRNSLWGIILVMVGLILGLNAVGITHINILFDGWWTLFIIIPCFINLFSTNESKTGNLIGLIIGIVFLLGCQKLVDFAVVWKLLFPGILVVIGLSCIFKNSLQNKTIKKVHELNEKNNKNSDKEYYATFSSQKLDFTDEDFTGCKLDSVFGSIDCDLEDAKIEKDIVIEASAIFGGITIRVPKDINVKVTSTAIFGSTENKTKKRQSNAKKTLYINSTCLFGGVEIK